MQSEEEIMAMYDSPAPAVLPHIYRWAVYLIITAIAAISLAIMAVVAFVLL